MKKLLNIIVDVLRTVFGWSILITLFVGGLTFFGYVLALILGGNTAAAICTFIYKDIVPIMIKVTTSTVLLGLLVMYISGETALTAGKRKN